MKSVSSTVVLYIWYCEGQSQLTLLSKRFGGLVLDKQKQSLHLGETYSGGPKSRY